MRLETHFLGGYPLYHRWEIADIGLVIMMHQKTRLILTKVALLQSKRLYPDEQDFNETEEREGYLVGFGRYFIESKKGAPLFERRRFAFTRASKYKALLIGNDQYRHLKEYEAQQKIPVHYLLYNPWRLPWAVSLPVEAVTEPRGRRSVGCRVVRASAVRTVLGTHPDGYAPAFADLSSVHAQKIGPISGPGGWPLERFVVKEVLACTEGHVAQPEDEDLRRAFFGRAAPISAAVTILFDVPNDANVHPE